MSGRTSQGFSEEEEGLIAEAERYVEAELRIREGSRVEIFSHHRVILTLRGGWIDRGYRPDVSRFEPMLEELARRVRTQGRRVEVNLAPEVRKRLIIS